MDTPARRTARTFAHGAHPPQARAGVGRTACVTWLALGIGRACAAWAWGFVTYVVFVALFTDAMAVPGWIRWLSPFAHLPSAPADNITVMPVAGVLAAGLAVAVAGSGTLRRRDLG